MADLERIDPGREYFAYALRRGGPINAPLEVSACKDILVQRNEVPQNEILHDIRWFNLDDLSPAPELFTTAQKDHLRKALQILHEEGWAHNDIQKPNVMIGADDLPRLIDFGETTLANEERIRSDDDRLEGLFRESVLDITALRRSRISERRRARDEELEEALGTRDDEPKFPSAKRLNVSLFD